MLNRAAIQNATSLFSLACVRRKPFTLGNALSLTRFSANQFEAVPALDRRILTLS